MKYSGWILFVILLLGIQLRAWIDRHEIIEIKDVQNILEDVQGFISFESFEHTVTLQEKSQAKRVSIIQGKLDFPVNSRERIPAVVLLHGSLGVSGIQEYYAKNLNKQGMATLIVDSFKTRGIKDIVGHQSRITFNTIIQDAYAALAILQNHPKIDPARIGVIGWSKGGYAAHQTGTQIFYSALHDKSQPPFAAHIAIYPWCGEQTTNLLRTAAPTLFIIASEDRWVGSEACISYSETLRRVGHPVDTRLYKSAGHGFDYPGHYSTYLPFGINWSDCQYIVNDFGIVEAQTGEYIKWTKYGNYLEECTSNGVYLKSDTIAKKAAVRDVLQFLSMSGFVDEFENASKANAMRK